MKKALFVATVVKTHIMTFHIPFLKMLQEMGYETAVAAKNDYDNPTQCQIPHCDVYFDVPFERAPMKFANFSAYRKLKKIIDEGDYDLIHCHTPVGAMLTRIAARGARKRGTRVIYTAHGFHFYKGAPLINWLVYFPVERVLSHLTDVLITINREDYERAKKFGAKKVCYVPGVGVDTDRFRNIDEDREKKRAALGLKKTDFLLLSVGELIERKNHTVVLRALAELKKSAVCRDVQYIICGRGVLEPKLKALVNELGIEEKVHFLGFRRDIPSICNCSDLFVFMSFQEGLPVALMEAMASGLPAVCSGIRGNTDLIEDGVSGFVVNNDPKAVADAIMELMSKPELREACAEAARRKVEAFGLENVKEMMRGIYIDTGR